MAILHKDGTITHSGLVVSIHSHWQMSMDIDEYFATVWNAAKKQTDVIYYGDNYNGMGRNAAIVDISEETAPEYFDYVRACRAQQLANELEAERNRLARGKRVCVRRGRKVAKGTIGEIFWIGNNGYGESVGIKTDSGDKHFTASKNVEVV